MTNSDEMVKLVDRLSLGDKYRLTRAGSDFGTPEFSQQACEWMEVQGFAKRKPDGRYTLTRLGFATQDALRTSEENP